MAYGTCSHSLTLNSSEINFKNIHPFPQPYYTLLVKIDLPKAWETNSDSMTFPDFALIFKHANLT